MSYFLYWEMYGIKQQPLRSQHLVPQRLRFLRPGVYRLEP